MVHGRYNRRSPFLASLYPGPGKSGGPLHGDQIADIGIAIVFFLHGLGISLENLRDGLSRWKETPLCPAIYFCPVPPDLARSIAGGR